MQFNGKVYSANWWTSSEPGSDGSWAFVDDCGNATDTSTDTATNTDTATETQTDTQTATETATETQTDTATQTTTDTATETQTETVTDTETATDTDIIIDVGELCADFNVYPNWTQGSYANKGDVMVFDNIAYSAKFYTDTIPGSTDDWEHLVNCDGTEKGAPAILSMPNPNDPISLKVSGWPNQVVVATPSTAPTTVSVDAIAAADVTDLAALTSAFEAAILAAQNAGTKTIIINGDILDSAVADKGAALGVIPVKEALSAATTAISATDINALSNNAKGLAQAYNLIMSTLATNAVFGWELTIGSFANDNHSGYRSVWNSASKATADLLYKFDLYSGTHSADILAFTKPTSTPTLTADQWDNALRFVKQVSDFVKAPALLAAPSSQAGDYFLGATSAERKLRHAAHHNVFAVLLDQDNTSLSSKIADYANAAIPLYHEGNGSAIDTGLELTSIAALNSALISAEAAMNNEAFLYEVAQGSYAPSTVYKWNDFLQGLSSMHNVGIAGNKFWLYDEGADDATNAKYAKVAIAAFLAQSMKETIRYDACDENNWSISTGDPVDYPLSASCGQLQQDYASYGENPVTGVDHPYSCPRAPKMEVTATTHAKWYGAPAPLFAAPDSVLEEAGILVNGAVGQWDYMGGWCSTPADRIDTSKAGWERDQCKLYAGQQAGQFVHNGSAGKSVEGCGWWGRGVIQTTGRQNFGTLNHFLGRSHVDPATVGTVQEGINVAAAPADPLYANLDFCSNPQLICTSEEHPELKWIAGLFYWVNDVQGYNVESGPYADWNYLTELKAYVDGGLQGTKFIDDISGIVNRGCPDSTCPISGEVDGVEDRQANFFLVLEKLGLSVK
ncbi:chitodextrinase [Catenovulum sp. SM1970]|nr:chitodextrinase [Marinifaba aquimaris]